jgi:uncharacterized protein (UPF0276 family)
VRWRLWKLLMDSHVRLGTGLGWRPALAGFFESRVETGDLGFVEVLAEHLDPRRLPEPLISLRDKGVPIVVHGLALSLGGAERPSRRRLRHLAACAEALQAPLVSEHLAFVRAGQLDSGHLLPVPRTRDALEVVCANIAEAQARLPVPLALENIATLIEWPDAELSEADFLAEVVERTGVGLLVDVANLYANARNHGTEPVAPLDCLPLDHLAYVHVAGGVERDDGFYRDTHRHAVPPAVLELLTELCSRGAPPGVLIEWDGNFPPEAELDTELRTVASVLADNHVAENSVVTKRRYTPPGDHKTERRKVAAVQTPLLAALVADGPLPAGFHAGAAAALAGDLRRRRRALRSPPSWRCCGGCACSAARSMAPGRTTPKRPGRWARPSPRAGSASSTAAGGSA